MSHRLPFAVNCSMLFTELPLLERPAAAKSAGFEAVEFWWPWPEQPVPGDCDIDTFVAAVVDAGVRVVGLNFYAGDLTGPDAGAVSVPSMAEAFRANVPVALGIGRLLDVPAFNALYGNRVDDARPEEQDELGLEHLTLAAEQARTVGASVLVEPVSGPKPYPLRTAADVIAVIERLRSHTDAQNVKMLADLYHLASNGDDVPAVIDAHVDDIGHVQIADAPGRGEPGTGGLDLDGYLHRLEAAGYAGWVGLEYKPTTEDSFGWLPYERRGVPS